MLISSKDELIAQSLICLRSSLEALRMKATSLQSENLHFDCGGPSLCKVEWMATLTMNQGLYFRELSRVLFKNGSSKEKKNWWLSTFYSFRIQALVRKALLELTKESEDALLQSQLYLHIPLRLFIAGSGAYDPLQTDFATPLNSKDRNENDYEQARRAVRQREWCWKGIHDSGDYLKMIYQDGVKYFEPGASVSSLNQASDGSSFSDLDGISPSLRFNIYISNLW
jgi:hypothetical protein